MKGKFIVVEGVDFTGKTTQVNMISSLLTERFLPHIITREPGGTKLGESVRQIVLESKTEDPAKEAILLLFMASRAENISKIVMPALLEGKHVICDRFLASTIVYQGVLSGFKTQDVLDAHKMFNYNLFPDLTILLDAKTEVLAKRAKQIDEKRHNNKYDFLPTNKIEELRKAFIETSKISNLNTHIVSSEEEKEEIFIKVKDLVLQCLQK